MSIKKRTKDRPLLSLHLRLVSKLAIYTSLLAILMLMLVLFWVINSNATTYSELIRSYSITRQNLGTIMLLSGLVLLALIGVITWLVCMYSSFLVAGPLYRFASNLEAATRSDRLLGLRSGDCLHDLSDQIIDSVDGLNRHYQEIGQLAGTAIEQLDDSSFSKLQQTLKLLSEREEKVRLK